MWLQCGGDLPPLPAPLSLQNRSKRPRAEKYMNYGAPLLGGCLWKCKWGKTAPILQTNLSEKEDGWRSMFTFSCFFPCPPAAPFSCPWEHQISPQSWKPGSSHSTVVKHKASASTFAQTPTTHYGTQILSSISSSHRLLANCIQNGDNKGMCLRCWY